jgi:hypothetical protein
MNSPPAARPETTNAGDPARPAIEVRVEGALFRRVASGAAYQLVARGWAEWRGSGGRRYIVLTAAAPLSAFPSWRGSTGTRVMRADGMGQRAIGQVLGERRSHLEHVPPIIRGAQSDK